MTVLGAIVYLIIYSMLYFIVNHSSNNFNMLIVFTTAADILLVCFELMMANQQTY